MNEILYRQIILKSETGYSYQKIIVDQKGVPCDYEFLEVNSAFEKYTGLDHSDIVGKRVSEILPKIKNEEFDWIKTYGDVALNRGEVKFEQYFEPLNRWYRVSAYSPEKYYFTTLFTDITNEKEQFTELNSFFDFSLDYMCITNKNGTILKTNQKWTDVFGNQFENFGRNGFAKWVHPEDVASFLVDITKVHKFGDLEKIETRVNCWDGSCRDFVWQAHVKNNFIYIQAEDITESKILKNQIEIKEKMLLAVFEFSQLLLLNINYYQAIPKGLEMIGKATNVDRVYYWENRHAVEDDQWYSTQKFEWCKDGTVAQIDNPELQNIPFYLMEGFIQPMVKGELFASLIKNMDSGNAKKTLESQQILSILVLPVYVNGFFHGFVGFDDCKIEKIWNETEVSLLKSFTLSLSKMIERNILETELDQIKNSFNHFELR